MAGITYFKKENFHSFSILHACVFTYFSPVVANIKAVYLILVKYLTEVLKKCQTS